MGVRGTFGENLSSHHCTSLRGWLGPGGDRGTIGHCCSSCARQFVLVTPEDETNDGQGPQEHRAQSTFPSFSHHLKPDLVSVSHIRACKTLFLRLLQSWGTSPGVHSARLCPPRAHAWLQGSIPAALLVVELPAALCKPSPQCRYLGLDLLLLASGAAWGHL